MITPETHQETPHKEESTMDTTNNQSTSKTSWKGKRGQLLQETGTALLSETGTDQEKIERFLEDDE